MPVDLRANGLSSAFYFFFYRGDWTFQLELKWFHSHHPQNVRNGRSTFSYDRLQKPMSSRTHTRIHAELSQMHFVSLLPLFLYIVCVVADGFVWLWEREKNGNCMFHENNKKKTNPSDSRKNAVSIMSWAQRCFARNNINFTYILQYTCYHHYRPTIDIYWGGCVWRGRLHRH